MGSKTSKGHEIALTIIFITMVSYGLCAKVYSNAKVKNRPNILWIYVDDQSPWYGAYGDKLAQTPVIDAIAEQGILFENAYAPAPVCAPSRSTIITGNYAIRIGAHDMRSGRVPEHQILLPDGVTPLPVLFRQAGYETYNAGKDDFNFTYDRADLYSVRDLAAEKKNMKSYKGGQGSGDWSQVASEKSFFGQMAVSGGKATDDQLSDRLKNWGYKPISPEEVNVPAQYPDILPVRKQIAGHYNSIMQTDHKVGEQIARLKADGLLDQTVVFLFSDHGSDLPRSKEYLYREGLHVPLVVFAPGLQEIVQPGVRRSDIVNLMDIAATSLALADINIPANMDSKDLFAPNYSREFVFSSADRMSNVIDRVRSVMGERYHYIRNFMTDRPLINWGYREMVGLSNPDLFSSIHVRRLYEAGKLTPAQAAPFGPRVAEELYDLKTDPDEINNLANDPRHTQVRALMRAALEKWIQDTDDKGQYPRSAAALKEVKDRLPESWLKSPEFN